MESSQPDFFLQLANSLQQKGLSFDEIGMQLRQQGAPEHLLLEIIMQLKSLRLTKKRNTAFIYCGIGVALLVIGCMLTIFLYQSGSNIKFALYGLTILGVVITLKGLADLMGW
jgi:hypothetical protein